MSSYCIYIPTDTGRVKIEANQILYIESVVGLSKVILTSGTELNVLLTVSEMEHLLFNQGFFRFNHNCLVNLLHVEVIFPHNASKVVLENGKEIFVNHNKRDELFESLREVYELHELV